MNYSSLESEYLVALIKSAIFKVEAPDPPSDLDWKRLIELSKQQQIYSVIACVLSAQMMPEAEANELKLYNQNELLKMLSVKTEQQIIEQELESRGIKYILLKGSVLKEYYPSQKMRQMSDVDILYDSSRHDEICEFMLSRGYKLFGADDNSDDFKREPYYTFEFHRELFFSVSGFSPVFDYIWDNAVKDKEKNYLYHMSLNDMYIYNICHMYKHFSKSCCGIRFLVDNYLFLKKEGSELNWEYIENKLKEYGILDFERQARKLAVNLFESGKLTAEEQKLLYYYTNFGIYGNELGASVQKYDSLKSDNCTKMARLKFTFKRLFPERRLLFPDYPILKKFPLLLPFVYVVRLFKGIFNKKIITEIEMINKLED